MADNPTTHAGWSRPGLHLRLSTERLASLLALGAMLPEGCSPSDAIDLAIKMASASRLPAAESSEPRFDDIDDAIERLARQSAREAARHQELAMGIARNVQQLRDLISAVAGPAVDGVDQGPADPAMPTLRAWLDAESAESPQASLLAKANWQSRRRDGDRGMTVELLVEALAAMPETGRRHGAASVVRLQLEPSDDFLDFADRMGDFYLACQRNRERWSLVARHIKADGSIGEMFGSSMA